MGREDLKDDPQFIRNDARVAHYAETEALVSGWTSSHTRAEIFAATSKFKIPCAPVRDLEELMNDPHMHGRGMLEVVDHYDYGPVVLPNSPLRFHGTDNVPTQGQPAGRRAQRRGLWRAGLACPRTNSTGCVKRE